MLKFLIPLLLSIALAFAAKPMEPLTSYNVILVHGAADNQKNGFECKDAEKEPYKMLNDHLKPPNYAAPWQIGHATGLIGSYNNTDKLTNWLDTKIFENKIEYDAAGKKMAADSSSIYIQRSFSKPAGSPKDNGHEVGDTQWQCGERRSLIEEAQEIKAKGRSNLISLRGKVEERDKLPPTRNILIAHSMGGVASREYVQGENYNEDVDKVITLDSPHEGTQALSLLINKHDYVSNLLSSGTQCLATAGILAAFGDDVFINYYSILLWTIGLSFGLSETLDFSYLRSAFPYTSDDPLAYYIDPDNYIFSKKNGENVKDLKGRTYRDDKQTPMFRLLYATQSLTFTNPKNSFAEMLAGSIIPDALFVSAQNFYSQIKNDNPTKLKINSAFASMYMGTLGLGLADNGSSLIPSWSGSAQNTSFLNDANVDVKKVPYKAAFNSENISGLASIVETAASAMVVTAAALSWSPQLKISAKIAIVTATSLIALPMAYATVKPFIDDFEPSHGAPVTSTFQSKQFANANTYYKISGEAESYTPYQMEEFLYEKPFANIHVKSSLDSNWQDHKNDTLGLYTGDSLKPVYIADRLSKPVSDWEQMGAKKEWWDTTARGVNNEKIPIRHADRYPMPAFTVDDFIQKYEFEIDDLMPHRLRQIRLNFNEEIS